MRVREFSLTALGWASFAFVAGGVLSLIGFLAARGLPALDLELFFDDTPVGMRSSVCVLSGTGSGRRWRERCRCLR